MLKAMVKNWKYVAIDENLFYMKVLKLEKVVSICFNKNPLKLMKNAFYFTFKALYVLEIFKFLFYPFGCVEKRLDNKNHIISPWEN